MKKSAAVLTRQEDSGKPKEIDKMVNADELIRFIAMYQQAWSVSKQMILDTAEGTAERYRDFALSALGRQRQQWELTLAA